MYLLCRAAQHAAAGASPVLPSPPTNLSTMSATYTGLGAPPALGGSDRLPPSSLSPAVAMPCAVVLRLLDRPAAVCSELRRLPAGPPLSATCTIVVRLLLGSGGLAKVWCSSRAVRMSSSPSRRTWRAASNRGRHRCEHFHQAAGLAVLYSRHVRPGGSSQPSSAPGPTLATNVI